MKHIVDTWAWIELLSGPLSRKTAALLAGKSLAVTSANVYELKVCLKRGRPGDWQQILESILSKCEEVIPITEEIALRAGDIKLSAKGDIGAVDCFVLAVAELNSFKVISGDPHLKGHPAVEFIG